MQVERPSFVQIPLFAYCSLTQNNSAKKKIICSTNNKNINWRRKWRFPQLGIFARAHKRQTHTHTLLNLNINAAACIIISAPLCYTHIFVLGPAIVTLQQTETKQGSKIELSGEKKRRDS